MKIEPELYNSLKPTAFIKKLINNALEDFLKINDINNIYELLDKMVILHYKNVLATSEWYQEHYLEAILKRYNNSDKGVLFFDPLIDNAIESLYAVLHKRIKDFKNIIEEEGSNYSSYRENLDESIILVFDLLFNMGTIHFLVNYVSNMAITAISSCRVLSEPLCPLEENILIYLDSPEHKKYRAKYLEKPLDKEFIPKIKSLGLPENYKELEPYIFNYAHILNYEFVNKHRYL